jgi:hypothetical protein
MRLLQFRVTTIACALAIALPAWSQDLASIKQALQAKYVLTVTTADKTDIVTPGSILVLKKTGLVTVDAKNKNLYQNSYRNGRITQNAIGKTSKFFQRLPGASAVGGGAERTFVSGEKVWITGIDVKENGVVLSLFTDAFGDTRYEATLTFPFEKYQTPTAAGALAAVAEVFDVQASDGGQQQGAAAAPPAGPAPLPAPAAAPAKSAEAPPPPIAPPPPPPADPKTISLGQTVDQVTSNFGQPTKVMKLGAKQIYVYPDMKVTFVGGKVTDIQ